MAGVGLIKHTVAIRKSMVWLLAKKASDSARSSRRLLATKNFAFARFDTKTFSVVPENSGDPQLYKEFTALKTPSMQTWIAIGGFDFSDAGPTHTAWSDMVSTPGNRAAFINSLKSFLLKYGFQGVDLDWEYPAAPDRGGRKPDTQNFVSLVHEMRASFGKAYGISLTLAPDYWYLRGFDAKAMEPSVDFFGFMAYDLYVASLLYLISESQANISFQTRSLGC